MASMISPIASKLRAAFSRKPSLPSKSSVLSNRMFAAGQYNRLVDWPVAPQRINADLWREYTTIVLRCRDLAVNNEHVIGLLRNFTRNVIGTTGFTLQSKAADVSIRPEIERLWREYSARTSGAVTMDERSSARDLDILILRSLLIDGEVFIHRVYDPLSRFGWRYEVIDSMQIDPLYMVERTANGGRIFMGIELDARGRETAYWFRPVVCETYYTGPRERIPAENMIHLFRREFASQFRGIPMFSGAVMNLRRLDDYKAAELVHAQISACCMGVWQWNGKNAEDIITDTEDQGEFVREIKPGIFPIAPRGYEAHFLQNNSPNNQFGEFCKAILRSVASCFGLSYNKASGDYESVNYSSLREAALEDRETFTELQRFLIDNWKSLQFHDFIRSAVARGALRPRNAADISRHAFFGRRFAWIDPAKEIAAKQKELALMLSDPITEIEARGEDPAEVISRFKQFRDMLKSEGMDAFWDIAFGIRAAAPASPPSGGEEDEEQNQNSSALEDADNES